ncbi:MAG: dockerin type I repeat-containing protein [Planctomycetota bacterium]
MSKVLRAAASAGLLSILVLSPNWVSAGESTRFLRGDVNSDAGVDIADPIFALNFLFAGGEVPPCQKAADANDDGAVDVSDPVTLLNYLFVGGNAPPGPFPECGIDETRDDLTCVESRSCPSRCDDCPKPYRCVPTGADSPEHASICTSELSTCQEVEDLYTFLVRDFSNFCSGEDSCELLFGHCGIGIGGCYHFSNSEVSQEHLDALAARFQELKCFGPVCDCFRPPDRVECDDTERCVGVWDGDPF